jgi:hypothetical protein
MPAFKGKLSEADRKLLAGFVAEERRKKRRGGAGAATPWSLCALRFRPSAPFRCFLSQPDV